jgi:hypothetical protein
MIGIQHKDKPVASHGFAILINLANPELLPEIMKAMGEDFRAYSLEPIENPLGFVMMQQETVKSFINHDRKGRTNV